MLRTQRAERRKPLPEFTLRLTRAEADALLAAQAPSLGWGVQRSLPLQSGWFKVTQAIVNVKDAAGDYE